MVTIFTLQIPDNNIKIQLKYNYLANNLNTKNVTNLKLSLQLQVVIFMHKYYYKNWLLGHNAPSHEDASFINAAPLSSGLQLIFKNLLRAYFLLTA